MSDNHLHFQVGNPQGDVIGQADDLAVGMEPQGNIGSDIRLPAGFNRNALKLHMGAGIGIGKHPEEIETAQMVRRDNIQDPIAWIRFRGEHGLEEEEDAVLMLSAALAWRKVRDRSPGRRS